LFKAFGKAGIKVYTSAGAMIERFSSGEHTIAYGIFGSYALARSKKDPNRHHPAEGLYADHVARPPSSRSRPRTQRRQAVLDYLLSKRGQNIIANQADLVYLRSTSTARRPPSASASSSATRRGRSDQ